MLHVSAGTTGGWRVIDEALRTTLVELGVSLERVAVRRPRGGVVRKVGSPVNDLYESLVLVGAARRGLRRVAPRAIIYSSSHAALLQPRRTIREAVWVDGPIALMRPGPRNAPVRALERMRQHRLDLVLPMSLQHPDALADPLRPMATEMLHMPVDPFTGRGQLPSGIEPPFGVMYAGPPGKKGLDIAVEAWHLASPGMRLIVTGIGPQQASEFLGAPAPPNLTFTGRVPRETHRELVRQAVVYVSASRREEYGTAQLEALADGIPLAAVPSSATVEPVAVARRLIPNLVAEELSAQALAGRIAAAMQMSDLERVQYAASAKEAMSPYSHQAFKVRLAENVLPLLLA